MNKTRWAIFLATAAVAGFVVFIYLIPRYSALYSIDSKLTRTQAQEISKQVAAKIGINLSGNHLRRRIQSRGYFVIRAVLPVAESGSTARAPVNSAAVCVKIRIEDFVRVVPPSRLRKDSASRQREKHHQKQDCDFLFHGSRLCY